MTRRTWLGTTAPPLLANAEAAVVVPVQIIVDKRVRPRRRRWNELWGQALRNFRAAGVELDWKEGEGEVERPQYREPVISGLMRGRLNVVVTDRVPYEWDKGRAWNGVTMVYRGYHLCLIALDYAHGHQAPLISLNTVVHEMLHALLGDIFVRKPHELLAQGREFRVDAVATRLWLFGDGSVRKPASVYIKTLEK